MRTTIAVYSRFHAFELAYQFQRLGVLQRLITTFPKRFTRRFGIADDAVTSLVPYELLSQASYRLPAQDRIEPFIHALLHERYDRSVARRIPDETDLFIGWSGSSEHSLAAAARRGAVTVVVRGSSHIAYQTEMLAEEFARFGVRGSLPDRRTIEKEIREYAATDYIAVPSNFARRTFVERGVPAEKMVVTAYGVDLSAFSPAPRRDQRFRLIYVGLMTLRKGVQYLLQAWSELNLPDAELLLVGSMTDEMKPFFAQYEGSFRYISHQPHAKIRDLMTQSSAFAICSIEDGMGLVVAQALACGLPVICTENTGGIDWYEDGVEGFVVPIRDVEALKERILFLYHNPDQARAMGEAGARRMKEDYSWDAFGERYVANYRERVQEKKGKR